MIDTNHIGNLIQSGNAVELAAYMKDNNLKLTDDNKIVIDFSKTNHDVAYWDKRQLVKKILLNSALIPSALV